MSSFCYYEWVKEAAIALFLSLSFWSDTESENQFSEFFNPDWKEKMILCAFSSILESERISSLSSSVWNEKGKC
ncbi:hypothetical protein C1645_821341 [Glomus cerebriforme]|uniref:Uncharacterized protein n=1 Tax=Glomus cerebriforme TaxID=658196 RepID=A0A397T2E7_9GLOM|nr:hypothetical protein C1645_821341 [Glomus cerebriforme]